MKFSGIFFLSCALGIPAGLGIFTFVYAKGYSYLSADPNVCINCHIMNEQFDGWMKSGHRHTTVCIDCHLPHSGLAKWVAKADQGFRHSAAFTLQNFKEPIRIAPHDLEIVRANCVRCHSQLIHGMQESPGGASRESNCLHCHRSPGH